MSTKIWIINFALLVSMTTPVDAALICLDKKMVDNGYTAELSVDYSKAFVRRTTISGSRIIETIPCEMLETNPLKVFPGEALLQCQSTVSPDKGFHLTVRSPDCHGDTTALLEQKSLIGISTIGEFICTDRLDNKIPTTTPQSL